MSAWSAIGKKWQVMSDTGSSVSMVKIVLRVCRVCLTNFYMKTITVRLPDSLVMEIEHESQSRHVSKSDIVRERLHHPKRASNTGDSTGDLISDILEASWRAKVPGLPRRFQSPKKQKLAEIIHAKK